MPGHSLVTAKAVAMARAGVILSPIPPIDAQGRNWAQPKRSAIEITDTYAIMSLVSFESLHEYSCSAPSGVYEGKMWRRHNGAFDWDFRRRGGVPRWLLCWYWPGSTVDMCGTYMRRILLRVSVRCPDCGREQQITVDPNAMSSGYATAGYSNVRILVCDCPDDDL